MKIKCLNLNSIYVELSYSEMQYLRFYTRTYIDAYVHDAQSALDKIDNIHRWLSERGLKPEDVEYGLSGMFFNGEDAIAFKLKFG